MNYRRTKLAREWAKKHNIQLNLFTGQYLKELKATKREKKLSKESSKKARDICQNLRAKEFEQMCKKARVDRKTLAKTVFTKSISST